MSVDLYALLSSIIMLSIMSCTEMIRRACEMASRKDEDGIRIIMGPLLFDTEASTDAVTLTASMPDGRIPAVSCMRIFSVQMR